MSTRREVGKTPRGGDGAPGHVLVDAAATAHWGYETATLSSRGCPTPPRHDLEFLDLFILHAVSTLDKLVTSLHSLTIEETRAMAEASSWPSGGNVGFS